MPRQDDFPLSQPIFSEPVFNESGTPTPDPSGFATPHPSDEAVYRQIQDLLTKDVVAFDPPRGNPQDLFSLATAYGDPGVQVVQQVQTNGQIVFQVVGDTGASSESKFPDELNVADAITAEITTAQGAAQPVFLYHTGDLVYDFGESQYYYDQFYDPYRNYPAPIIAIPGNHDSFVIPNTPAGQTPLDTFTSNFCAMSPVVTQEAGSLHRTAGLQPGVYFTLDAPFVRIIGLFSNALEDPGVISSENGKWPISDAQLDYLGAQLQQVIDQQYAGAVLLAVHHPPFSYSQPDAKNGNHGSSLAMLAQIDTVCAQKGVYPHAVFSSHAHNYQRYLRSFTFNGATIQVPFTVCGNGGHNVIKLSSPPAFGSDVSFLDMNPVVSSPALTLQEYDSSNFGYQTVTVTPTQLTIQYNQVTDAGASGAGFTPVVIALASRTVMGN